tara:strand:+ start:84401 stop:85000 length:600 start_codon:yes stop_codon:yes gene_type:complete
MQVMDIIREKHRGASDNPGRFAAHTRAEADLALAEVTLQSAGGYGYTVVPGVLDSRARQALSEGQCVAFAVAVAERLDADTISVLVDTDGGDRICHAWVERPDGPEGRMVDSWGERDVTEYFDEFCDNRSEGCDDCDGCASGWGCDSPSDGEQGLDLRYIPVAQMREIESQPLGRGLPRQSWEDVRSFVEPLMKLVGER